MKAAKHKKLEMVVAEDIEVAGRKVDMAVGTQEECAYVELSWQAAKVREVIAGWERDTE